VRVLISKTLVHIANAVPHDPRIVAPRLTVLLSTLLLTLLPHLLARAQSAATFGAPPDPVAQDQILDAMHQYAAQYVSNLPNFLCLQVTRQFEAGKKSNRWHQGDTLVAKLSFNQGREERTLDSVNGKPVGPGKASRRPPLSTEGEFGILLSRVLGPDSEAWFTWSRWETLRGKRLAVFDFTVDKQHSTLRLSLSDLAKAIVPYRGSIYADPSTGAVWRISDTASDIPPQLLTREISTTIDYGEIPIGDRKYLLPVQATVSVLLETKKIRNEMEFQDYRKFEADSAVTFGPEASPSQPAKPALPATTPKP
jgi:hypothetical protein